MDGLTQLEMLEEEERHARMRLEADRRRLARSNARHPPESRRRLRKLEREWKHAADRLHRARLAGEHRP